MVKRLLRLTPVSDYNRNAQMRKKNMFSRFLFCYALICVPSSFAIILMGKRKLVALLCCHTDVMVLLMFCGSSSRCRGLVCSK